MKEIITAEMVGDPDSPLIGMTLLSGEDKPRIGHVFQSADDAMVVRSMRLPTTMYDAAVALDHPSGFSGVVRDALAQFLGTPVEASEVKHALDVLTRAAARLEQAA